MLFVVVCIFTSIAYSEAGLSQRLPFSSRILGAQLFPSAVTDAVQNVPERDVSYSISYGNYLYLKRHKVVGQDSPYNPEPTEHGHAIPNHNIKQTCIQCKHDVPLSDVVLKRSAAINSINGYNNPLVTARPVVEKHMYFHVPPPDFEEPSVIPRVTQPPKQKVNIVFIKAPSYAPKDAQLQQLYQKQQASVSDKTLIYVLSKKEEPPLPVVLPPKPSPEPEVFFVNYKMNPNDIVSINNELSLPNILQNVLPVLERRNADRHP